MPARLATEARAESAKTCRRASIACRPASRRCPTCVWATSVRTAARPPAAAFIASPDRKTEHPLLHLAAFSGVLQADGYAGFNKPSEGASPGSALIKAACRTQTRRKFFDVHARIGSAVAFKAPERFGAIHEVERSVSGKPTDEHLRQRRARSRSLAAARKAWAESILPQLSAGSDHTKAFRYIPMRWAALTRVFGDSRIATDDNPAERSLWDARTTCSPDRIGPPSGPPPSTRRLRRQSLMARVRRPTSATCSPVSQLIRTSASSASCPGTGRRPRPPLGPPDRPGRSPRAHCDENPPNVLVCTM